MEEFDCYALLDELNLVEKKPEQTEYGVCCGEKMQSVSEFLLCYICGSTKNMKDNGEDSVSYGGFHMCKIGNREIMCFRGDGEPKSRHEKIASIVKEFHTKMNTKGICIEGGLLNSVCEIMHDITCIQNKKSTNRDSLFIAILYHVSVLNDQILMPKEVQKLIGNNSKFSKGNKIIIQSVLDDILDRTKVSFGIEIYEKLIIKYLSSYDPKFYLNDSNLERRNINTATNRKFCINMIEIMLNENISYNSIIQSKCIAVVYYLIKHEYKYEPNDSDKMQKEYFTKLVGVGENTYIKAYKVLLRKDVQKIFVNSGKFTYTAS